MFCEAKILGDNGRQDPRSGPVRGYVKLADATKAFNFDFRGKVVLDIGSSTGGFTEYALDHGATKVIAVEKGTNQMKSPLRYDPRIELHEKTDIFDFDIDGVTSTGGRAGGTPAARSVASTVGETARTGPAESDTPDVVVADVSFLSLKPVLSHLKPLKDTDFLMMLKPQFEAHPDQLNNGIVKNDKIRREIIKDFEHWLAQNDFIIINKRDNTLKGKTGNQERFYWLRQSKHHFG